MGATNLTTPVRIYYPRIGVQYLLRLYSQKSILTPGFLRYPLRELGVSSPRVLRPPDSKPGASGKGWRFLYLV